MFKRILLVSLAVASTAALPASSLAADSVWKLKPGLQGIDYDTKRGFDDSEKLGGSLGLEYQYGRWGTELQLSGNDAETGVGLNDIDVLGAAINQYAYFNPGGKFNPYFVLGAGHADFNAQGNALDSKETQANAGLGFQHQLADRLGWWLDVRGVHGFDESTTDTVVGLGLALGFGGGAGTPALVPVPVSVPSGPADADMDGVADANDMCPGTKRGVAVNSSGCALDSDGDGVADYKDKCPGTVRGIKVDKDGCKLKVTRVEEIKLDVQFQSNSSQLQAGYMGGIEKLANFMQKYRDLNVILEGHTDSAGDAGYNQDLSQKRAERVKTALVNKFGIDAARITTKGFGEARPVADNSTREGRAANRRVIAALTKTITE